MHMHIDLDIRAAVIKNKPQNKSDINPCHQFGHALEL